MNREPRTSAMLQRLPSVLLGLALVIHGSQSFAQTRTKAAKTPPRLEALLVQKAPDIDGAAEEEAWGQARSLRVLVREISGPKRGQTMVAELKSVRTRSHIYFLVSWDDATADRTHKTWVWDAATRTYVTGPDREDVVALAFQHTGEFRADMLLSAEGVWDVWQWKAARTDPAGYAMDKTHRYTRAKPKGKAKRFEARDGKTLWIARPEDGGASTEKKRKAPKTFQGQRVAQYLPAKPSGSAADIRAKGRWSQGRWTVEMARRLTTGHVDDRAFAGDKPLRMGLSILDREEHAGHSVSRAIELVFRPTLLAKAGANVLPSREWGFEDTALGALPKGWKTEATDTKGSGAVWSVVRGGFAGKQSLAQTRVGALHKGTSRLCWTDLLAMKDGRLSVRLKAGPGSVEGGGGLVWRVQDRRNYYLASWSPLRGKLRLYRVQDGKKTMLASAEPTTTSKVWHKLSIVHRGRRIECSFDGVQLLSTTDGVFERAGGIGVWAQADAVASFDKVRVRSLRLI